jgi:DegV family protein with EDD domain
LGVTVVPAYVQIGERSLQDGAQITRTEFYRLLPQLEELPTTSVPPAAEFAAAFRLAGDQAEAVVAVLVSASLSGMLNSARLGSQELSGKEVHLVDSEQLTMGLGWQVIVGAEAAAEGKGPAEVLEAIEQVRSRVRVFALLDTMENLRRSGRVDWARAMAARVLNVKPLIEFRRGEALLVGRARTRSRAIERLLEMVSALGPLERVAVLHSAAPDHEEFVGRVSEMFPRVQVQVSEVGPIVGTHVGPRALGVAAIIEAQELI